LTKKQQEAVTAQLSKEAAKRNQLKQVLSYYRVGHVCAIGGHLAIERWHTYSLLRPPSMQYLRR